jgi:hypothetical protein
VSTDPNPFESPQFAATPEIVDPTGRDPRQYGKARQVRVVAVLMIVHGVLLCIGALCLFGLAWFVGDKLADAFAQQQARNPQPQQQLDPAIMTSIVQGMYGVFGVVVLIAGLLGIFAGIRNYSYRNRTLGIVALIGGMVSIMTCYCLPLSGGLLIYGLIIYLSRDAEVAFRWQEDRLRGGDSPPVV